MIKFKQVIRQDDVGLDVLAVKRTIKQMNVKGANRLAMNRTAGPLFKDAILNLQRAHRLNADGVYGPKTHALVAPHFDARAALWYRLAKVRKINTGNLSAEQAARQLLVYHQQGRYHDDSGAELAQIIATANGRAIKNEAGEWIHIDARVMRVLVYLIQKGYRIGTFAMAADHGPDNSPHGHSHGHCVDISSINGVSVATNSFSARLGVLRVAMTLRSAGGLRPWQLICGGYGYHRDWAISRLCIPAADSFYGAATMSAHTNHIHVGYY